MGVIQSSKVDSICEDVSEFIKNLNVLSKKPDILYGEINFINFIMNSIDDSVVKSFTDKELPNKEVVRRIFRLDSIKK